jgi:hypothetical protein
MASVENGPAQLWLARKLHESLRLLLPQEILRVPTTCLLVSNQHLGRYPLFPRKTEHQQVTCEERANIPRTIFSLLCLVLERFHSPLPWDSDWSVISHFRVNLSQVQFTGFLAEWQNVAHQPKSSFLRAARLLRILQPTVDGLATDPGSGRRRRRKRRF